jgi:hypothetical protein
LGCWQITLSIEVSGTKEFRLEIGDDLHQSFALSCGDAFMNWEARRGDDDQV